MKWITLFSVHGSWGEWGKFGACSSSCGTGLQYRTRSCDNPEAANGGKQCIGDATDSSSCLTADCPGNKHFRFLYIRIGNCFGLLLLVFYFILSWINIDLICLFQNYFYILSFYWSCTQRKKCWLAFKEWSYITSPSAVCHSPKVLLWC